MNDKSMTGNTNRPVLVFVELEENGNIAPISLEVLNAGRSLADSCSRELNAIILGSAISVAVEDLSHYNINIIYSVDNSSLKVYQPELYLSVLKKVNEKIQPSVILLGNTLTTIDLAPRISFDLDTGLVTDCIKAEFVSGEFLFTKPVYSGNVLSVYSVPKEPCIATIRSRAFDTMERFETAMGKVATLDIEIDPADVKIETIDQISEDDTDNKLATADVVVAGGRGVGLHGKALSAARRREEGKTQAVLR